MCCSLVWRFTLEPSVGHFGSRVAFSIGPHPGHMSSVVTWDGQVEETNSFPSALVASWVIVLTLGILVGVAIGRCCSRQPRPTRDLGRWEHLVRKAIFFVGRRRRVALAFQAYRGHTLRNSEGSRPSAARRAARQRAQTPGAQTRVLNEGPALVRRRHGSD